MNITFLIGNGFDINIGLKTKYQHFYDYLKSSGELNNITNNLKELNTTAEINLETAMWRDLEIGLGIYTKEFDLKSYQTYRSFVESIIEQLALYIDKEQEKLVYNEQIITESFRESLFNFPKHLVLRDENILINAIGKDRKYFNFISFNYSVAFNNCVNIARKNIGSDNIINQTVNIHGTTGTHMLLGVDNETQILNKDILAEKYIRSSIIKPEANSNYGLLIDKKCKDIINSSNIICLFGLSIGVTDQTWWKSICEWLKASGHYLIIFKIADNINRLFPTRRIEKEDEIKYSFLSYSDFSDQEREIIAKKIFVCLNTDLFKMTLVEEKALQLEMDKYIDTLRAQMK